LAGKVISVFLKALTLKGFKSFADSTTLTLEPGVTVVVGPNGSGKSNVVDAIAWVLGAQAPSAVRSQKMDDVIFAGTSKRPALGRAEVSLTLDNSSGLMPIEFNEVTITRTLFRSGESEYAINGAPCRLLDIQDLLSDSGVGRQQHVIVSQGQIDAVLNARPEDRRAIIEEAAGVLKYRKRKEKAERRLEATEANFLRVQDLLREVRRQLRPLERQAEAARRHGDLIAELNALRIFLAGREIAGYRERMKALSGEQADHQKGEKDLRDDLARLDTDVLATEARLSAMGGFDLGDQLTRAEQLSERIRGLSAVLAERRRGLERDRGRLMDTGVVANLEADANRLRTELDDVEAGLARLDPDQAELLNDEESYNAQRAEFDGHQLTDEGASDGGASAVGAAAEVRGELRTLRTAVERGSSDASRLAARIKTLQERTTRLDAEVERYRTECEQSEASEQPLVRDLSLAEAARRDAELAVEQGEAALRSAQGDHATWTARAEALTMALDAARSRAGAERLVDVDGVVGTLLDLVDVDDGWEAAFEAGAGEALSAVVVDDLAAARRALQVLRDADTTGAVLPLVGFRAATQRATVPNGVGDPVRSKVRSKRPEVEQLLDSLLAGVVAVDGGWAKAVDAALAHPDAIVVTRHGDRFGHSGWRVGAVGSGATGAALEEASDRALGASTLLNNTEQTWQSARAALAQAVAHENELTRQLDMNDARFTAAADGLGRSQAERREAATEAEALALSASELDERLVRERSRIVELENHLPSLESVESAQLDRARRASEARAGLDARGHAISERRREFEVRGAGLEERSTFLRTRLAEIEVRLEADAAARADAAEQRNRVDDSVRVIDRLSAIVDSRREGLATELAHLQEQRRKQSEEARVVSTQLDGFRRERAANEKKLEERRERLHRIEIEEAEVRMRLETIVESIRRELDIEPEAAMAVEPPVVPEGTNAAARVRDLERELRIMGPINPLALEEFNALQERHTFLEAQLEDVKNTRRELANVIRAVDAEIQNVFAAAYADVSTNFTALFAMLFPGGTGRLILTNPDDLLNTGIEVEAKPSGKNVKKLSLLSGGERSLTALAYLFAVFRSRPSPFYVMDEVEAALDDVNLHRFLGLVQEFRSEAQLLIVSHQKRTMEAGDCLFGVTMQPGGSSKVVAERVTASA
jgi:chromosome segregation protein